MKAYKYTDASCDKETDKAVHVEQEELGDLWIPKSVLHDDSDVYGEGHEGSLIVATWWIEENEHETGALYRRK